MEAPQPVPFLQVDRFFVRCHANSINNNNIATQSPFRWTELNGTKMEEIVSKNTGAVCDECGVSFSTFSALCAHQAKKPCPTPPPSGHKLLVTFPRDRLCIVESLLHKLDIPFQESKFEKNHLCFEVDGNQRKTLTQKLYFSEVYCFNMENWYPYLLEKEKLVGRPLTAPTSFIPLSDSDLKILQKLYTRATFGKDSSANLTRDENDRISDLENRIGKAMSDKDYFVKISTRSPKDAVRVQNENPSDTPQQKLQKKLELLRIHNNPAKVVQLLSKSARVFGDISNFFQTRVEGTPLATLSIVLREWSGKMDPSREFRCYVHQGKLTAISQYNPYDVFQSLQSEKEIESIRDRIVGFHEIVHSALKKDERFASYVLDVCVPEAQTEDVQLIELNPFGSHMSSGSGLFSWLTDDALLYGKKASEDGKPYFRVLSELLTN